MLKASLEILADVKAKHQRQERRPDLHHYIDMSASFSANKPSDIVTSQEDAVQQLPVNRTNIFTQTGSHIPFEFVRSVDSSSDNFTIFSNFITTKRLAQLDALVGQKLSLVSWPFRTCIELRAAADLGNVRLVVISTQGSPLMEGC